MEATIAAVALAYHRRGWKPVPVSRRTKRAIGKGWQNRLFDPAQFDGNAQNVAVQFGAVSNGLADVDLDCTEAISFAPEFLPSTDAIFGRRSKPCSHQLYVSDLHATEKAAVIAYPEYVNGKLGPMLVELRIGANGKGAVSVFPPSMHETGETVQWVHDGEPASIGGADLKRAVVRLAVACLLKRHYPGNGAHHEAALVIGGVLARAGWDADDIKHVIGTVARAAGDDDVSNRVNTAAGAVDMKANGENVSGLTRLCEVWGRDVADTLAKWLHVRGASSEADVSTGGVSLADFRAFMPMHSYIYIPTREMWPASSINARLPKVLGSDGRLIKPSACLTYPTGGRVNSASTTCSINASGGTWWG
jgi:hypothetical protein